MEIGQILRRIGLESTKKYEPTLDSLKLLMNQYLLSVPYENLDFALNRGFSANILKNI